jgi:prepilin-type N-terminal cleavage/methylation domain-containing protein/prepilin-type processing-associated H-X9-DG protein
MTTNHWVLRRAFTLVELLVVIAVIGILAALLLPVLSKAKTRATVVPCLNNQKQLALAWQMYGDDNGGKMVNFNTYNIPASDPLSATNTPWRTDIYHNQLIVTVPAGYSADQAWIYKIEMGYRQPTPDIAGPLFRYAPNSDIVHCPGDKRYQLPVGFGFAWDSYSGVTFLNGENGGFFKETQVLHPSDRFLWVEGTDGRGENVGSWEMDDYGTSAANFSDAKFGDSPAAFHVNAATFNFADGHVESHRWLDASTIAYANSIAIDKETDGDGARSAAQDNSVHDQQWVSLHYPGPQNP